MLYDTRNLFGTNVDLDAEPSTVLFTNQIDLEVAREIGMGQQLYLVLIVTEAFTDGGDSATVNFRLRSDDSAAIHATTSTAHWESGEILKEALTLGTTLCFALPQLNTTTYERYIGLQAVIATAGFDAGMVTAFLTADPIGWKSYPDATN